MARPDKVAAVAEVRESLQGSAATLLTHFRGLSVPELQQLRSDLREANASYRVIKNTLSKRAMADAGIEGLDELLEGPTALVFCEEDPVGPAKALKQFQKDHPDLLIRGGYLDGEVLDADAAARLADLESKEELLAKLAGLMNGALTNTARLLKAKLEDQGRLIQALVDAGGPAGDDGAEAAPAADAEPEADASAEAADDADAAGDADGEAESGETAEASDDAESGDDAGDDQADEAEEQS